MAESHLGNVPAFQACGYTRPQSRFLGACKVDCRSYSELLKMGDWSSASIYHVNGGRLGRYYEAVPESDASTEGA
jgi:hypothetical protein